MFWNWDCKSVNGFTEGYKLLLASYVGGSGDHGGGGGGGGGSETIGEEWC